jgi:integrase
MRSRTRKTTGKRGHPQRAPIAVKGTVPPRRLRNATRRPREYLTVKEVELLMETARRRGRYGHRDATMILIAFRHGLRPSEVCALRWDMVDLPRGLVHVRRSKNGTPSVQPLGGIELRALRKLKREEIESRFVFMTERAAPITTAGYRKMMSRTGASAEFPFPVHPHMLRHACGYKLANDGQDILDHPEPLHCWRRRPLCGSRLVALVRHAAALVGSRRLSDSRRSDARTRLRNRDSGRQIRQVRSTPPLRGSSSATTSGISRRSWPQRS